MERWLLILICASALVLIAGIVIFLLVRSSRKKSKKKVRNINMISPTELGTCHLHGTTEEFDISFAGTGVSFLVRNGIIVGHRDKSSSPYVMYPLEKEKERQA